MCDRCGDPNCKPPMEYLKEAIELLTEIEESEEISVAGGLSNLAQAICRLALIGGYLEDEAPSFWLAKVAGMVLEAERLQVQMSVEEIVEHIARNN